MSKFKKQVLELLFDFYDKFYMHVVPAGDIRIGERGFVGNESEHGLVLVFGASSYKNLRWDNNALYADMRFSGKWESLVIPFQSIVTVFDDPGKPDFVFKFSMDTEKESGGNNKDKEKSADKSRVKSSNGKIVKVDFSRKDD
ncbi:hypothetical protein Flexsi_1462 [Flexistipes sinusarabici DSM 4947]|uniref:Stringent starvation protein B n=1 Tax=Flexistipes sinusarabici (strain ATCC 49648 / DSM 4947 / MAS 10) TaxID=717231 RepID=F8E8B5_FLESM|nr:ClpXP protease specificity-enhancing factor SspB [Flexistipes sinusarabici]AEI15112.1 hypothetical protein Flexsi_1462 [Flexistipes sinusarabici DSM 4947]